MHTKPPPTALSLSEQASEVAKDLKGQAAEDHDLVDAQRKVG